MIAITVLFDHGCAALPLLPWLSTVHCHFLTATARLQRARVR